MSKVICIAGESGSGKTTAMRNLNPEETVYIDCDKKGLSWKEWKQQYNAERKNYFASDFPYKIKAVVAGIDKTRLEIHYIVIDTINGIMVGNLEKTRERKFISGMNGGTNCCSVTRRRRFRRMRGCSCIIGLRRAGIVHDGDSAGADDGRIETAGGDSGGACQEQRKGRPRHCQQFFPQRRLL
ncbi:MAG: AAA family ATPase [Oscillospiraceae bacterium]